MTEPGASGSAGALLRAARERQGLHIAALAAALKVTPRKLEALEGDRHDELPDAAFARALALAVCRTLKIDSAPVLARLPAAHANALARAGEGLNQPLRTSSGGHGHLHDGGLRRSPLLWGAAVLVVLALVVLALPQGWRPWSLVEPAALLPVPAPSVAQAAAPVVSPDAAGVDAPASAGAATEEAAVAPQAAASVTVPAVEVLQSAPAAEADAAAVAGVAVLRATEPSWVEAIDAGGAVLLQRTLQPGETVGLDGRMPLRLRIGNAAGTQLSLRGTPVDLAASTRDNIARLELQ